MQLKDLHDQFKALDHNKSGLISAEEIMKAVKEIGMNIKIEEVQKMIDEIDYYGD
jgi:Ca2+-binding EF-hand superfamily protein